MGMIDDIRFPVVGQLEAYWEELRRDRVVPPRSEVDPRRIENCLEYAFILERIAPGLARFRLAGTHLNDLIGMEVRGMPLTSLFTPDARKDVTEVLEDVFSNPATALLDLSAERGFGKPAIDGKLLLLPMKSDFGDVTRALGCLVTQGQIGRTPRRFEIGQKRVTQLSDTGVMTTHVVKTETPRPVASGFAEEPGNFVAATPRPQQPSEPERPERPKGGRPHLYVVKSDD
ncbi:PAS domain-containing protein [Actibacterium sp. 188UL27-1]|uniref:PAS domain-containing protein n=1 Tax=Actibacterium sp. 188UL27-1 TaxID=2786961 RepID=UPI00195E65A6|nr:PAS domain-containing protein [Actibacterium sp. 188UL27-1]MBM7066774.1 PAS domain-containing protein [Actibacterium sp. 188UL27-1]